MIPQAMQARKYRMSWKPQDWHSFIDDYSAPVLRSSTYDLTKHYGEADVTIGSHFLMDAFLMHVRPYESLVPNPLASNSWKEILEKEMHDPKYQELNQKISRNPMLSMMATRNFLDAVIDVGRRGQSAIPPNIMNAAQQPQQGNPPGQQQPPKQGQQGSQQNPGGFNFNTFMNAMQGLHNGNAGNQSVLNSLMANISTAASGAAERSEEMMSMMSSFSHSGIPMRKLVDPDEMREILANRLVVSLAKVMKKLSTDETGRSSVKPSVRRGLPIGVKTMRTFAEIPDIIPQEMLNEDLLNYRIASRTVHVRERFASMNRYMVYLDKSGSMGGTVQFDAMRVPRIAVAAASAMGLAGTLRRHGGSMSLKLFDTEVQEPVSDMWDLLRTLARISADGGTNITRVLEDIQKSGRDYKTVIISDGIDSIQEDAAAAVRSMDVTSILIQTSNPILEKYTRAVKVEKFTGSNILMEV